MDLPQDDTQQDAIHVHGDAVIYVSKAPDMETRAELFNEGFDTAHRQGIGGDASYGWLIGKLDPILDRLRTIADPQTVDNILTAIADVVLDDSLERGPDPDPRPDTERGMFGKYFVQHMHDETGKHDQCRYFVLDPQHDPIAVKALAEYGQAVAATKPKLAADLQAWIATLGEAT